MICGGGVCVCVRVCACVVWYGMVWLTPKRGPSS